MKGFEVRTTKHFDRALKKLARAHPDLAEEYEAILPILSADPFNL